MDPWVSLVQFLVIVFLFAVAVLIVIAQFRLFSISRNLSEMLLELRILNSAPSDVWRCKCGTKNFTQRVFCRRCSEQRITESNVSGETGVLA